MCKNQNKLAAENIKKDRYLISVLREFTGALPVTFLDCKCLADKLIKFNLKKVI